MPNGAAHRSGAQLSVRMRPGIDPADAMVGTLLARQIRAMLIGIDLGVALINPLTQEGQG